MLIARRTADSKASLESDHRNVNDVVDSRAWWTARGNRTEEAHPKDWITDEIVISNRIEARDGHFLREGGFLSILSLEGSTSNQTAEQVGIEDCVFLSLIDGPGNTQEQFDEAVEMLDDLVDGAAPVLVHCHAGRSRSVAVVAAWLRLRRGLSTEAAFAHIEARRETTVTPQLAALARHARALWS